VQLVDEVQETPWSWLRDTPRTDPPGLGVGWMAHGPGFPPEEGFMVIVARPVAYRPYWSVAVTETM